MSDCETPAGSQLWGKYRGVVAENFDPLAMGRLLIEVPQVPGTVLNWAMPCVPYAGPEHGFFAMPEPGANVWVEFEAGNPSYPIWVGCYWDEGQAPFEGDPFIKCFTTPSNMLILDDTPEVGGASLISAPPAVDDLITLKFSSEGVLLTAPPGVFNMSIEAGITLEFPPCVISMSEAELSAVIPASGIVLTEEGAEFTAPDISLTAEAAVQVEAGADINLGAVGAVQIEAPAVAVTAAGEWLGDLNITGGLEVEGPVNIVGAVIIVGEQNNVGAMQIEGDFNVLGPTQMEGVLVVMGLITMDGAIVLAI